MKLKAKQLFRAQESDRAVRAVGIGNNPIFKRYVMYVYVL